MSDHVRERACLGVWRALQCQSGGPPRAGRERGAWETEAPKGSPRGEGGDGSRWQRGAMDAAATHLPTAHLRNPLAEVSNEDTRGLIGECF